MDAAGTADPGEGFEQRGRLVGDGVAAGGQDLELVDDAEDPGRLGTADPAFGLAVERAEHGEAVPAVGLEAHGLCQTKVSRAPPSDSRNTRR